jgi:tetratricopeptide (TPR) repeat protein
MFRIIALSVALVAVALPSFSSGVPPADYLDNFNDSVAALDQKDYAKAIRLLTKMIEQVPEDFDAFVLRGAAYQGQGKLETALDDFNEAIRLSPEYVPALISRGTAWQAKGDLDKAFADFDVAVRLEPKNYGGYQARGDAWKIKGELDKALHDYDQAIRLDPFNAYEARDHRAWIRATCSVDKCRDGAKAVEDATKACEWTYWKMPEFFGTLAAAHAEAGDFDKAVEWQQKAIDQAPEADKKNLQDRLALYQEGKPYREEPVKK